MILTTDMSESIHLDREIQGCELSISDKAKCIICQKIIAQGTPRLWVLGELKQPPPDEGIVKIKRFICNACIPNIIESKKKDFKQDIITGNEATKKLIKQNTIEMTYLNYLKKDDVILKIRNDEIMRELEEE